MFLCLMQSFEKQGEVGIEGPILPRYITCDPCHYDLCPLSPRASQHDCRYICGGNEVEYSIH
jgi:hypothetical protein